MAKTSKKLTDFFGGRRRSCTLIQSVLLKSKGNEKRMKLTVSMPLSNTNLTNAPEPFLTQFSVSEKEDSASNHAAIDVQFDSMAVSIYSIDEIAQPTVVSQGALLHRFAMIGKGTGEKRTVSLDFLIYLPATTALREWEWNNIKGEFFLEAAPSQHALPLEDEADEEENEGDEEEEPDKEGELDPDNETEAGEEPTLSLVHSKSGPSDLAAYHEKQLDQEQRRPRGRPKGSTKNRVDPLTVNEATAF
jgi:hypothetical protein